MFTGIIEDLGEIADTADRDGFRTVRINTQRGDIHTGDSIAVNGVCLTARAIERHGFIADLSRETLERTSLDSLAIGTIVNLERPMRADGRFGGHIVQGHVDGVGLIRAFDRAGGDYRLEIEYPESAKNYVVEKGSITVDGISLTIARLSPAAFDVAIIPHTFDNTNLKYAKAGDRVNLEFDVLAKYVERMLANRFPEIAEP